MGSSRDVDRRGSAHSHELHNRPSTESEAPVLLSAGLMTESKTRTETLLDQYFPHKTAREAVVVSHRMFNIMLVIIMLNCLQIGVECQFPPESPESAKARAYLYLDAIFLMAYLVEVFVKIKALGVRRYFCDDSLGGWNCFDFVLTFTMLVDFVVAFRPHRSTDYDVNPLRPLRVLRAVRIVRILRVLKNIKQLAMVVGGLWSSMYTLFWVAWVLAVMIYGFAVALVLLSRAAETEPSDHNFSHLHTAMGTLLDAVFLEAWTDDLPPGQPQLYPVFYLFVICCAFGCLNVIVGVIVDATRDTKWNLEWEFRRRSLKAASKRWEDDINKLGYSISNLEALSSSGTGSEELRGKRSQRHDRVKAILQDIIDNGVVPLPPGVTPQDMIRMVDKDGDGDISHDEFVLNVGRVLLGDPEHVALWSLINQGTTRHEVREVGNLVERVEQRLEGIDRRLEGIDRRLEGIDRIEHALQKLIREPSVINVGGPIVNAEARPTRLEIRL